MNNLPKYKIDSITLTVHVIDLVQVVHGGAFMQSPLGSGYTKASIELTHALILDELLEMKITLNSQELIEWCDCVYARINHCEANRNNESFNEDTFKYMTDLTTHLNAIISKFDNE